jgi:hypothetical protein
MRAIEHVTVVAMRTSTLNTHVSVIELQVPGSLLRVHDANTIDRGRIE